MADYVTALLNALGGERQRLYQENPYITTGTSLIQEPVTTGVEDRRRPWINALFGALSKAGGGLMRGYGLGQAERKFQDYSGKANDLLQALGREEAYAPVDKEMVPLANQLSLVDALQKREQKRELQELLNKEQIKSLYGEPKVISVKDGAMVFNPDGSLKQTYSVGEASQPGVLDETKNLYEELISNNKSLDEGTKKAGISLIRGSKTQKDIQSSYEKLLRTSSIDLEDPEALKIQKENYKSLIASNNDLDEETKAVGSSLIDSASNSKELVRAYSDYAKDAKERVKAKAKQNLLNIPDWKPGPGAITDPIIIRKAFEKKDAWNKFLRGVEKLKASIERGGQAFTGKEFVEQQMALAQMDEARKIVTGAGAALTPNEINIYFAMVPKLFANPTSSNLDIAYNTLKGIDFKDQISRLDRYAKEELNVVREGIGYLPDITITRETGGDEKQKRIQEIRDYISKRMQ